MFTQSLRPAGWGQHVAHTRPHCQWGLLAIPNMINWLITRNLILSIGLVTENPTSLANLGYNHPWMSKSKKKRKKALVRVRRKGEEKQR